MSGRGSCLAEAHVWQRLMSDGGSCLAEAHNHVKDKQHEHPKMLATAWAPLEETFTDIEFHSQPDHNHRIFDHRFFVVLTNTLI